MKLKVYTIYDSKIQTYMRPFFLQANGAARRAFEDLVNDKSTEISRHPEDYTLFELATFDDQTGVFENANAPTSLGLAQEYIREEKNPFQNKTSPVQLMQSQGAQQ